MFTPLICGSNFTDEEDDEEMELLNLCSETKKSSRRTKDTKNNPYAERGLDKFSALLAQLDSKRQKIYTQKGSEDISLLGFVYSNSSDYYKPIVIRQNHDRMKLTRENNNNNSQAASDKGAIDGAEGDGEKESRRIESNNTIKNAKAGFLWGDILKLDKLRGASYYVPVIMMMLILVLLAFFGKSFAIVCTSLAWYVVIPTIKTGKKSRGIKKEYVKGLGYNDKIITAADHGLPPSSPTSVLTGEKSPPRQGHGRRSS